MVIRSDIRAAPVADQTSTTIVQTVHGTLCLIKVTWMRDDRFGTDCGTNGGSTRRQESLDHAHVYLQSK